MGDTPRVGRIEQLITEADQFDMNSNPELRVVRVEQLTKDNARLRALVEELGDSLSDFGAHHHMCDCILPRDKTGHDQSHQNIQVCGPSCAGCCCGLGESIKKAAEEGR